MKIGISMLNIKYMHSEIAPEMGCDGCPIYYYPPFLEDQFYNILL